MYENRYASREDIDAAMRLGCGLPMGPLALMDLIGIDTAYEILDTMYKQSRNRLHAPEPDHQADDDRRAARPEVRPRLLHLRRSRLRRGRRRRRDTRRRAARPRAPARCETVGVVGSGTMATGIIEVVAKGGYDVALRRPRAGEGRGRARRRWPSRWRSRSRAASSTRPGATRSWPGSPGRRRWTTSPTATWSSRRSSSRCR